MMDIIRRRSIVLILFLVFFLFCIQNYFILSLGMGMICKQSERTALLSFKQHLNDPENSLSSWSGENCCSWYGVVCSNTTDHVVQLQLQQLGLGGELNPEWLYSLTNLQQLDLSANSFQGTISPSIGNLTKLTLLHLSNNQLEGEIPTAALGNLCKLRKLDLRDNKLTGEISGFLGISSIGCIARSLEYLDLSSNQLSGPLPDDQLGRLQNLEYLSLGSNSFSGSIPFSIGRLTSLRFLDLRRNELNGSVPEVEDEDWFEMKWFYMSMGVGFAVGYWLFWVVIVLKRSWRIAYFQFLDDMKDKICLLF